MRGPGLVFDLDGTLVDSVASITEAFSAAVAEGGHAPVDEAVVRAKIGEPLVAMFQDLLAVPPKEAETLAVVYREHYAAIAPRLTRPLPGVPDLLDAWGLPMAVATTKRTDQADLVLEALGLRYRFADVIGIDRVAVPKPHPFPILEAALSLGLPPSRCVVIGDTKYDILAARAAGAPAIGVLTGAGTRASLEAAGADFVVPNLHALDPSLFDKLAPR